MQRNTLAFLLAAASLSLAAPLAQSQPAAYPARAITFLVPFTPGTGMDMIARTVGPKLSARLGQPVVVENKPGASGNIGAEFVARSAPDGYTVMIGANTMLIAASLYKNVPFDPLKDFAPVSQAAFGTLMLVTNAKSGIESVQDMIAKSKAKPGVFSYASPGVGTPHHMSMELLKDLAGIDLLHVPYKGTAGAITDTLSGQINVMFMPIHVAMPHVKAGRLKALAVGSARRHPSAGDVPTLTELGIKGADVDMWYPVMLPKNTPAPIVAKLNAEIRAILAMPDVKATLDGQGMDASSSTPEELQALMQRDFARWAAVIKKNGISAE
jgi:tripartite-type tricarboxylate transporter receptor subunit TctC